jgi:glucose-6-phosphate isomerase
MAITLRRFDARSLGALVALFERAVGLYGELVNVNAYHQPGVEAGKAAAAEILDLQKRIEAVLADGQPRSVEALQEATGSDGAEGVFWILRHLCMNDRGYGASGDWGRPAELLFHRT